MNGPFHIATFGPEVRDSENKVICRPYGASDEDERRNAEMICDALNSVYYAGKARGDS